MSVARTNLYQAAQKFAWQVPAEDPSSLYLLAFNLEAWPVTSDLEYDLECLPTMPESSKTNRAGLLRHQWVRATTEVTERKRLAFRGDLPASGYRQFRIHKANTSTTGTAVVVDEHHLKNEHLRVTFQSNGAIQIFDKMTANRFSGA